jgi:hypothetical protein
MKFNLFKEFKKDLNLSVNHDLQNLGSKINKRNVFLFFGLVGAYIYFRPYLIYYRGMRERKLKIDQLKQDGKWVLDDN